VPPSCALLGGFAIGARVSLLRQHSAEREMSASACTPLCLVIFVLIYCTSTSHEISHGKQASVSLSQCTVYSSRVDWLAPSQYLSVLAVQLVLTERRE